MTGYEQHRQSITQAQEAVDQMRTYLTMAAGYLPDLLGAISNAVGESPATDDGRNALFCALEAGSNIETAQSSIRTALACLLRYEGNVR